MTVKELRSKSDKDLNKLLAEKRNSLREAQFKHAQRQLKDHNSLRATKSSIARIQTILKERKLAASLAQKN